MMSTTTALVQSQLERARNMVAHCDYANARRVLETALWKAEQLVGQDAGFMLELLELLGRSCYELSQYPIAVGHLGRLLALQHSKKENPDKILQTLDLMVRCYEVQGRLNLAETSIRDAVQLCSTTWGETAERTLKNKKRLVNVLMELRRPAEAEELLASVRAAEAQGSKPAVQAPKKTGPVAMPLVPERKAYLGQILRSAGLISYPVLSKNLELSKTIGLPLGEVLIAGKFVERSAIMAALEIQSMIRADQLEIQDGIKLLQRTVSEKITVAEAMSASNAGQKESSERYRLGRLLVASGQISEEQLSEALKTSRDTDVPLGKHLVLAGLVPPLVVAKALEMQTLLFEGGITEQAALAELNKFDSGADDRARRITQF
jgi:hypothetical protein